MVPHRSPFSALLIGTVFLVFAGCTDAPPPPVFQHDLAREVTSWSHDRFDDDEDTFTFAIFSDLTGGEREGVFAVAIAQLSLLHPAFIINPCSS